MSDRVTRFRWVRGSNAMIFALAHLAAMAVIRSLAPRLEAPAH